MKKTAIIFMPLLMLLLSSNIAVKTATNPTSDSTVKYDIQSNNWGVVKVEGKELLLNNGKRLKTSLFNLKYIGQLQTKSKAPYFILSGRSCTNCDENISIYIWCPSNGVMLANGKQPRYSYPGKEKDYATNEIVYENRMFYGSCSTYKNSVIWIQRSLNGKKVWENSVFIVTVVNDKLQEIKLPKSNQINGFLNKESNCKELPGIVTTTEP
jgi:hypothetical protein